MARTWARTWQDVDWRKMGDICASRDDAQPHIWDESPIPFSHAATCAMCGTERTTEEWHAAPKKDGFE